MIASGEIVVLLGDQRLFVRLEDGQVTDLWTVNDLMVTSRKDSEIEAAIARADGARMFLRDEPGARQRELTAHERLWFASRLRIAEVLARIDADAAARTPEQTARIERFLGERSE